jgi:hypothetical protein
MARKARSYVSAFRKLLLLALVLLVVGVVGLFMFGKAGQRRDKPSTAEEPGGSKGMTLIGEDFDYTFTDGSRPVFHIKGESIKADREGTIYLDRVGVTLWESEDAMRKSREQADRFREQAGGSIDAGIESVNEYEVAVWVV